MGESSKPGPSLLPVARPSVALETQSDRWEPAPRAAISRLIIPPSASPFSPCSVLVGVAPGRLARPSFLPPDYLRITTGLLDASARTVIVAPIVVRNQVRAVAEIALLETGFDRDLQEALEEVLPYISLNLEILDRTLSLLEETGSLRELAKGAGAAGPTGEGA
ncbi:hypothetical protein WCLP8_2920002 [uncultured Gammaproteobacteria bacterium]